MREVVKDVEPLLDEVYALPLYSQAELVGDAERDRGWQVTAGNRCRLAALREPLPVLGRVHRGAHHVGRPVVGLLF